MALILIIDDEPAIIESLNMFLVEKGHEVITASTGREGLKLYEEKIPQIVILDIRLPDVNGLDLLNVMVEKNFPSKVIMITAYQDMESTIIAIKRGAVDYIHKPLDIDEIEKAVNRAENILKVDQTAPTFETVKSGSAPPWIIIGKSEKMRSVFKKIGMVCNRRVNVLLQGETGTGKELIARVIHINSAFKKDPFVVFDCSAVVETLLESELFGHEKGAFTGADTAKKGKIELAGNGTLFLDEIAELPLNVQGKLLGFLQRKEYTRVGGTKIYYSDCRIITASNCDLSQKVKKGEFKEDLYFRLRVFTIKVPPLRERLSDIPLLVEHFLNKINLELGTHVVKLEEDALHSLSSHQWKGNVRELENAIVHAVVASNGNVLLYDDLEKILESKSGSVRQGAADFSLAHMERLHIHKTLFHFKWNKTRTAKALGISLPTLRSKIRKYDLKENIPDV